MDNYDLLLVTIDNEFLKIAIRWSSQGLFQCEAAFNFESCFSVPTLESCVITRNIFPFLYFYFLFFAVFTLFELTVSIYSMLPSPFLKLPTVYLYASFDDG
jgi:hypothetical protein